MPLSSEITKRFSFNWEILQVIIGGKSAIDSAKGLDLSNPKEIARFMEGYGYDLENPIEKAELFGSFQEALSFIRRYFLYPENEEGLKLEIPRKISELTDFKQLLIWASQPTSESGVLGLWSCSVIKVMHTISHIDKDLRANYFKDIQTQILDRFYKFVHTDEHEQVFLGRDSKDPSRVDLKLFESKPKKARDSLVLKLLHKSEHVAEDIFDRVGIRFVTKTRFDALRVVKFLKENYVIMPPHIKPSRSRNTLIDTEVLSREIKRLLNEVEDGKLAVGDLDTKLAEVCEKGVGVTPNPENPHSSSEYRTIQFTCRQLIKSKNPLYDDLKELKNATKGKTISEEIRKIADRIDLQNIQKEIRFFYPYEVQIYDEQSHKESIEGESSHANYKKSQVQSAMYRVMGGLIQIAQKKLQDEDANDQN